MVFLYIMLLAIVACCITWSSTKNNNDVECLMIQLEVENQPIYVIRRYEQINAKVGTIIDGEHALVHVNEISKNT